MSPEFLRFPSRAARDRFGRCDGGGEGGAQGFFFSPEWNFNADYGDGISESLLHVLGSLTTGNRAGEGKDRRQMRGGIGWISYRTHRWAVPHQSGLFRLVIFVLARIALGRLFLHLQLKYSGEIRFGGWRYMVLHFEHY